MVGLWDPANDAEHLGGPVERLSPTEASAVVTHILLNEGSVTVHDVVHLVGYSNPRSARRLLERISRVLPIFYDDVNRKWKLLK